MDRLPARAEVFTNLAELRMPEQYWREFGPACHQVSKEEESGLIERLLRSKMVTLIPESSLPRRNDGRLMTGGFFCVKKNSEEDRLIFDRRPENATMRRLHWAELPSAACLTRMRLKDNEFLRGSGDDLRNYYCASSLPPGWERFNSVGRRVDPKLVKAWGGDLSIPHRAAMRVLGMGDTNACDIAQAVHEHILERAGLLGPDTRMVYGKNVPQGPLVDGAYLDDLLIVHRVETPDPIPLDGSYEPPAVQGHDLDMVATAAAEQAYKEAGLARAEHKSFRGEVNSKAWGAQVDGVKGVVGAPMSMRRQIVWLLIKVIGAGVCLFHFSVQT